MKLNTFLELYKSKKDDIERNELLNEVIKSEYIPYEKKISVAKSIVDICYWDQAHINLHLDSTSKYMLTCISIIDLFTNIERETNKGKVLEEFNQINEAGLFEELFRLIDNKELREFRTIINMIGDDLVFNEYEPHAYLSKQIVRLGEMINQSIAPVLEQLDVEKLEDTFIKTITKNDSN